MDKEFFDACHDGNLAQVKQLLTNGADFRFFVKSYTPLLIAAKQGRYDVVQYLLDNGVEIDQTSKYGFVRKDGDVLFFSLFFLLNRFDFFTQHKLNTQQYCNIDGSVQWTWCGCFIFGVSRCECELDRHCWVFACES